MQICPICKENLATYRCVEKTFWTNDVHPKLEKYWLGTISNERDSAGDVHFVDSLFPYASCGGCISPEDKRYFTHHPKGFFKCMKLGGLERSYRSWELSSIKYRPYPGKILENDGV